MKKCVILSMDDISDFESYEYLLEKPLVAAGWQCDTISWREKNINWNDYQLVMIRTPWDYQTDVEGFLSVLHQIENSQAQLDNALSIVEWNIDKKYLKELQSNGVLIVPTLWKERISSNELACFF